MRTVPLASGAERLTAGVCVIGAGIAGLIAATRIASRIADRVVVLESGAAAPAISPLDAILNTGHPYVGEYRARGIGGTSGRWAGKLLTLSPRDMAARPHVGIDAWPVEQAALDAYTAEVEALLDIGHDPYQGRDAVPPDQTARLPDERGELVWRWPKRPSRADHRIDHVLRRPLARLANLDVRTDATVTSLRAAEGRLREVVATNGRGGTLAVAADHFVLAAGTLETTRLLLLADAQNDGVIARTGDALGRYFNDHFGLEVARLHPADRSEVNRALADRTVRGTIRHLHGELTVEAQRAHEVASAYVDFDAIFAATSGIGSARALLRAGRDRDAARVLRHLSGSFAGLGEISRAAVWRLRHRQAHWPSDAAIQAKLWVEQVPRHGNRLYLTEQRDALGSPMLAATLNRGAQDERTIRVMTETLDRYWRQHMAENSMLTWLPQTVAGRLIDVAVEQGHPAGSTRMGRDPARSVVDPDLRVHALPNVTVASASAFPSSGSANPTMTIMQLAMLAADRVIDDHRRG
jgi:choline dehydrogenase-like flavoprotein